MAQIDDGPATGTAVLFLGSTASIEVHIPSGVTSNSPIDSPYVDPQAAGTTVTGAPITTTKTTVAGIRFAIPA
jgi:hypothetical protein